MLYSTKVSFMHITVFVRILVLMPILYDVVAADQNQRVTKMQENNEMAIVVHSNILANTKKKRIGR